MLAVIFEFWTDPDHADIYWSHAKAMSELVKDADGFISIERFQSCLLYTSPSPRDPE